MKLTLERLKQLVRYDPDSGKLLWNGTGKGRLRPEVGCLRHDGYMVTSLDQQQYLVHRLILFYVTGEMPSQWVDHINGIKNDNRLCNLRLASPSQNNQNRHRLQRTNTLGYPGIYLDKRDGFYYAKIKNNKVYKALGRADTAEKAYMLYAQAKKEMHSFASVIL